jgi:predicted RNA binding protein YcfA (HicA-like mRNA interferase family)
MNTAAKLVAAMRRNPRDWQLAQLQTVARQHGVDWRHDGGSHCVFVRHDGKTLPVPAHPPIKPIYVKKLLELVDGA